MTTAKGLLSFLVNFFSTEVSAPAMVTVLLSSCSPRLAMGMNLPLSSAGRYSSSGWPVT